MLYLQMDGITQIKAIKKAIAKYGLDIKVYGMVKDNKHTTRALITETKEEIKISQELMNLITQFQDTVHETAIEYHRKIRDKQITKSALDDIPRNRRSKKTSIIKKIWKCRINKKSNKRRNKASKRDKRKISRYNKEKYIITN